METSKCDSRWLKVCYLVKPRMKKLSNLHWPELNSYFGCCEIPTGIYIRFVLTTIITIIATVKASYDLKAFIAIRETIINGNISTGLTISNLSERDTFLIISKFYIGYIISWIVLRGVYSILIVWTVYAVYVKSTCYLKITLWISIPLGIAEFLFSFVTILLSSFRFKIITIILFLSELYHLLVIRSYYMKLKGISRLEANIITQQCTAQSISSSSSTTVSNTKHCNSCTCDQNREINDAQVRSLNPDVCEIQPRFNRINISDDTEVVPHAAVRKNSIDLEIVLSDEPKIYDKQQLNLGSSPVLEDRYIA